MADFLEERMPVDMRMGMTYGDDFSVEIVTTSGGNEYRRLRHPYLVRHFTAQFTLEHSDLWTRVIALYHRAYGIYAGFRVKCLDDFTTNGNTGVPTPFDQPTTLISAGVFQLTKQYGLGGTPLGIGLPKRTIYKPVANTVRVAIGALEILNSPVLNWTVDTTTGRVYFSAAKAKAITAISQAAQAVVTVGAGHGFLVGDYPYFSGVLGMIQINGLRAAVLSIAATTITVNINSSAFGAYTSGGTASTAVPQGSESVTAGCEFDIPAGSIRASTCSTFPADMREAGTIDVVELLTP
jgi:uncharacterized protein (TIGR02217 family)